MKLAEIKKVEVIALGMGSIMELCFLDENKNRIGRTMVSSSALKRMGVIKRADACGKAEKWFNTEEGFSWVTKHAGVEQ